MFTMLQYITKATAKRRQNTWQCLMSLNSDNLF